MYARVWKFNVLSDKVEEFGAACRAVGAINRKRPEFRGFVVVRGGSRDAPECTVVSVWDSLEALRASEGEAFQKSLARVMACCQPGTVLQEEDVLICDFGPARAAKGKPAKRRPAKKKKKARVRRRAS
jgi:heme-degrading monooxygenase HmoA